MPDTNPLLAALRRSARDAYVNTVPLNVRAYGESMLGVRSPITESDLTQRQRRVLAQLVAQHNVDRVDELSGPEPQRGHPSTRTSHEQNLRRAQSGSGYMDYSSYGAASNGIPRLPSGQVDRRAMAEIEQLRTTLGRFPYEAEGRNLRINDTYDFNNPSRDARVSQLHSMSPMQRLGSVYLETRRQAGVQGASAIPRILGGEVAMATDMRPRSVRIVVPR